jgi:hypothetical protein
MRYGSVDEAADDRPYPGGPLEVVVRISASMPVPSANIALTIRDTLGTKLIHIDTDVMGTRPSFPQGTSTWAFRIQSLYLKPGTYQLDLRIGDSLGIIHDRLQPALRLNVHDLAGAATDIQVDAWHEGIVVCKCDVAQIDEQHHTPAPSTATSYSA